MLVINDCTKPILVGRTTLSLNLQVVIGQSGRDTVAVKMANGRGERAQAMLLAEIRLLSQLRCTYIVKYLGYSIHNNAYMLLTAFHARGNLFDSLRASDEFQFRKG